MALGSRAGFGGQRVSLAFNRRDFLRTSLVLPAAAGAGFFAYQRLDGGPLKTAIVGTGAHGREALIRQSPVGHIQYVGFFDIRPSQADAARTEFLTLYGNENGKRVKNYTDWNELLLDKNVDAVVIAVPPKAQAKLAIEALQKRKAVYLETPGSDNTLDLKAVLRVAKEVGAVLATGYHRAGNARYTEARQSVASGTLGDVKYIETFHHANAIGADPWLPPIPAADAGLNPSFWGYTNIADLVQWRAFKTGGGMLCEYATHQFDALRLLLGDPGYRPIAVTGTGGNYVTKGKREVDDHVFCRFELPNDVIVTWAGISTSGIEGAAEMLLGTRGSLWMTNEQDLQVGNPPAPAPPGGKKLVPLRDKSVAVSTAPAAKGGPTMYSAASVGYTAANASTKPKVSVGYTESLQKFAAAVRAGSSNPVGCNGEQALALAVIARAAEIAIRDKRRVEFKNEWFQIDSVETPDPKPADSTLTKAAGLNA